MGKIELPIRPLMYAMPVTVIGAMLGASVNYMTAAYCGVINHRPPMLYVSLTKSHATTRAILDQHCFSVSIPTLDHLVAVDYCGITSGNHADKSGVFQTFFGKTGAPMPEGFAVNMECGLVDVLDYGGNDKIFVGNVEAIYADEEFLTDGKPDVEKIHPICLDNGTNLYYRDGKYIAKAYALGKKLQASERERN